MEAQTLLGLTAIGLVGYFIFDYFYTHFTFWQKQGVPSTRFITLEWMQIPFFEFTQKYANHFAPSKIYGVYGPFKVLVVNDPKIVRDISTKEMHKFPVRNSQLDQGTTNIQKGLFFLEANEDWKRIRSIVTPAFTSGKLRKMITPIERISNNFIEHLRSEARSGAEFDLKKYLGSFAMDVIAACGYGIELDSVSEPNHPVVVNAKKILNVDMGLRQMICLLFPQIAKIFHLDIFDKEAVNYFDKLTLEIIEKRRTRNGKNQKQNPDLLGLMMEESQQNSSPSSGSSASVHKGISHDELSGQGILFFIAGFDTTHATFDHVIYYLTQHPEYQERLFQELNAVRDALDYDAFKSFPLLNAIINETLRLNPPLADITREAKEDCQLLDTGIKILIGTLIAFHPYVIHRDPDYFDDPLTFKPERFLGTGLESSPAFMPFGAGSRLCVGMRFAQNELRIGLANFILNYKVTARAGLKLEYFKGSVLMSPKSLPVKITER